MTTQTNEQEDMYYLDDEMNNEQCSYRENFVRMNSKRKDESGDGKKVADKNRRDARKLKRNTWEN